MRTCHLAKKLIFSVIDSSMQGEVSVGCQSYAGGKSRMLLQLAFLVTSSQVLYRRSGYDVKL